MEPMDCFDKNGRRIKIGDIVSSQLVYVLGVNSHIPVTDGVVTRIFNNGVDVLLPNQKLLQLLPAGTLKIKGKAGYVHKRYVWRVMNELGRGPYFDGSPDVEQDLEKAVRALDERAADWIYDPANGRSHPNIKEDWDVAYGVFGKRLNSNINGYQGRLTWDTKPNMVCGFLTKQQAKNWFSEKGLTVLALLGFKLKRVRAAKIVGRSAFQCMFIPQSKVCTILEETA